MTTRSYDQFCPAARTLDVLGERWTLLIIRDLLTGPKRWSDLRTLLPRLGANLLAERLKALEAANIIVKRDLPAPDARTVYDLTDRGRELDAVILALARFGLPYLDVPADDQPLLPHLRDEALRTAVRAEAMPDAGGAVRFELSEGRYLVALAPRLDEHGLPMIDHRRITIRSLEPDERADADAVVVGELAIVLWVRRGELGWDEALDQGLLEISGDEDIVRQVFGDGLGSTVV